MSGLADIASALGLGIGWGARALVRELARRGLAPGAGQVLALSEPLAREATAAGHQVARVGLVDGRLDVESGQVDAGLAAGLANCDVALAALGELQRVVKDGGLVLVASGAAGARGGPSRPEMAALFLHAGLVALEQRAARGVVLTSARVRR